VKVKLDENLGEAVAAELRAASHDVATIADEHLLGASDPRVLDAAYAERRCLVTLDLEFGNPLLFDPAGYSGIVVIRLPARATHAALVEAVRTLVQAMATRSVVGNLWIVHRNQVREYHREP
jgi:predicted nuclease of predicted toxin-antitoxin system